MLYWSVDLQESSNSHLRHHGPRGLTGRSLLAWWYQILVRSKTNWRQAVNWKFQHETRMECLLPAKRMNGREMLGEEVGLTELMSSRECCAKCTIGRARYQGHLHLLTWFCHLSFKTASYTPLHKTIPGVFVSCIHELSKYWFEQ